VPKLSACTAPVLDVRRQHALTVRESYGEWGGLTERERVSILEHEHPTRIRQAHDGTTRPPWE